MKRQLTFIIALFIGFHSYSQCNGLSNVDNGNYINYEKSIHKNDYPYTIFLKGSEDLNKEISNIASKIRNNESSTYFRSIYNSLYLIAQSTPSGACKPGDQQLCADAKIARNAAFVYLMNIDNAGDSLTATQRNRFKRKAKKILEDFDYGVPVWAVDKNYSKFPWHTKNLILYLQAYDLLRGAGVPGDTLCDAKKNLHQYTRRIYKRASALSGVMRAKSNNHSLMAAGALGLAAIVLQDVGHKKSRKKFFLQNKSHPEIFLKDVGKSIYFI